MSWWPFALDTTIGITIVIFGALYGMLLGMDASAKQKQKQRQFRESAEYREWRDSIDNRR
jgi:hypothetical protein